MGVPAMPPTARMTPDEKRIAYDVHARGSIPSHIAEHLGRERSAITRFLSQTGPSPRQGRPQVLSEVRPRRQCLRDPEALRRLESAVGRNRPSYARCLTTSGSFWSAFAPLCTLCGSRSAVRALAFALCVISSCGVCRAQEKQAAFIKPGWSSLDTENRLNTLNA